MRKHVQVPALEHDNQNMSCVAGGHRRHLVGSASGGGALGTVQMDTGDRNAARPAWESQDGSPLAIAVLAQVHER